MFKNIRAVLLAWLFVSVMLSGEAFAQSVNDQFQYQLEQQRQQEMINQQSYQQNENYRRQQEEQSQSTNSGYSQPPRTVIVDRFGAVAVDYSNNTYAFSSNMNSSEEATIQAFNKCGTSKCEIVGVYANSCASVSFGLNPKGGSYWFFVNRANLEVSKNMALKECNRKSNNCQILVAECSRI